MGENIDLRDIFNILKKNRNIILIITTIAIIIGGAYNLFLTEVEYKTNTTLLVKNNYSDSSKISSDDINVSQRLAITYGEIIKSRTVIDQVINELGLNISYEQLIPSISVNIINNTQIINISVSYDDSKKSYEIANKLNEVFLSKTRFLDDKENIQILDSPVIPQNSSKPSIIITIFMATVLGLILSLFIIFIIEYFNDKITTTEDVEKYIKLPLLGVIPCSNDKKSENDRLKFTTSEAFKTIRSNIEFSNVDKNLKLILVTSTKANEGKTTVASQLSLSFAALENKNILLIDCDLRNPSIHRQFNIINSKGLTDILMNENNVKECINFIEIANSKNQKLSVITTGEIPSNPSELLSSQMMKNLLSTLKNEYDYIFIDSPPIGIISDASIVSNISDGTILIVGSGEINIKSVKTLKDKLSNSKSNIIGVILNKSKKLSTDLYNNGYYYSYSKEKNKDNIIIKIKELVKKYLSRKY